MKNNEHLWAVFSEEEVEKIVQLKRIFECTEGDPSFNKALAGKESAPKLMERLRQIGITLEVADISFFWEIPEHLNIYVRAFLTRTEIEVPPETVEEVSKYPLLLLWGRYIKHGVKLYDKFKRKLDKINDTMKMPKLPQFEAWRKRRILATKSELGWFGEALSHPVLCYELSDGCSVGCWFCAFATHKFKSYLDYAEYKDFFCNIIKRSINLFGKKATGWALPYYRSEPHDNPDYIKYLQDFEKLTGAVLCTSTAVGDDIEWVRSLVNYYRKTASPWPRLSVLSVGMMKKIHEGLTPGELRDVQLLMQMRGHSRKKVTGGRILAENSGLRECTDREDPTSTIIPQGSIACASGFLINLINRTIEVFSPCYSSNKWPSGYRVFDRATFKDENDFTQVISELVTRNMYFGPPMDKPLRFRDDLVYQSTETGFDLISPNQIHHFKPGQDCGPLVELINKGRNTYREVNEILTGEHGKNPLVVQAFIQRLFDGGFIDEVYN